MNDVQAVMEDFEDSLAPEMPEPEAFTPATDEQFQWAMMKKARADKAADALREAKASQIYELSMRFDALIAEHGKTADFFHAMIERGVLALEPDSKGHRKVKTVAGTAYTRTSKRFAWPDDDALVEWAKKHLPDAVKVKETPDKTVLKAHVKDTGELPDGLEVTDETTVVVP